MMCEACERGDHFLCGMQTWCECDCDPRAAIDYVAPDESMPAMTRNNLMSGGEHKERDKLVRQIALEASKLARLSPYGEKISQFTEVIERLLGAIPPEPSPACRICGKASQDQRHNTYQGGDHDFLPEPSPMPEPMCVRCGGNRSHPIHRGESPFDSITRHEFIAAEPLDDGLLGYGINPAEPQGEGTAQVEFSDKCCSRCGAPRLISGVCSLVAGPDGKGGCPDPTYDYYAEKYPKIMAEPQPAALPGVEQELVLLRKALAKAHAEIIGFKAERHRLAELRGKLFASRQETEGTDRLGVVYVDDRLLRMLCSEAVPALAALTAKPEGMGKEE